MLINRFLTTVFRNLFQKEQISEFDRLVALGNLSTTEKEAYQENKLLNVLESAKKNVPYYSDCLRELNTSKFNYDDFKAVPFLTKDIIRSEGLRLKSQSYPDVKNIIRNTSGGSTGEPVTFYQTTDQKISGAANYYYANYKNGVSPYDRSVVLWGAVRDMHNAGSKSFTTRLRETLNNTSVLNTFVMSPAIISSYISEIKREKPIFIKAYVHSIYEIAKYINKHKIKIDFKPIIHTTTGPLYDEIRAEIKAAFNDADVFNFYGSREVSAIAAEFKEEKKLNVLFDNVYVEIIGPNGHPVKNGEEGEIVITTLNNEYMPLIRYKIGDRAIKGDSLNGTQILNAVLGRTLGIIYREDGSYIDGQYFTTLFFNEPGIERFQLVQKTLKLVELKIIKGSSFDSARLESLIFAIKKELPNVEVNVNITDNIDLTKTGKIMYVYSELDYTQS